MWRRRRPSLQGELLADYRQRTGTRAFDFSAVGAALPGDGDLDRIQTSDFPGEYEGTVTGHSAHLTAYIHPDSLQLRTQ